MSGLYLIPSLICLSLGAAFLLIFRYCRIRKEEADRSITAQTWGILTGTGTRTEENFEHMTSTVHYGIYEYDTADGQHISCASASAFGYLKPDEIPGAERNMVKILYNSDKPSEFILPEEQVAYVSIWSKFKQIGIFFTVMGVLLAALAIAGILGLFNPILNNLL